MRLRDTGIRQVFERAGFIHTREKFPDRLCGCHAIPPESVEGEHFEIAAHIHLAFARGPLFRPDFGYFHFLAGTSEFRPLHPCATRFAKNTATPNRLFLQGHGVQGGF